jgi:endonuclease/exonuclease/phosphatase family metal-dependent hydrolase
MTLELKVMTWNIHIGTTATGQWVLDEQANYIKDWADVALLQEVDQHTQRSKNVDQLAELANIAGFPYAHFAADRPLGGGEYGNGILSKFPITATYHHEYPGWYKEQLGLQHCTITIDGDPYDLLNTHWSLEEAEMRRAANCVLHYLDASAPLCWPEAQKRGNPAFPDIPVGCQGPGVKSSPNVILAGDFNNGSGTPESNAFVALGFRDAWGESHPIAAPSDSPVDLIFYHGPNLFRRLLLESPTLNAPLSDHAPWVAVFDILTKADAQGCNKATVWWNDFVSRRRR